MIRRSYIKDTIKIMWHHCKMKSLVFLLLLAVCSAQPLDNRIIGGSDALPGEFPYTVSIQYNDTHHCGGTIINSRWILTSAHCVKGYPKENLKIVAGATKLSDGGDVYKVLTAVYHEGWGALRINDIGLLLTDEHIQFGDNVNFMHLGTQEVPLDRNLLLTGWGYTTNPGESSDHLKFIELTSISLKLCTAALETLLFDTQLCTYNGLGEGACEGDSGSPLVYMNRLVGIASYGRQCAIGKPDVFTKVSAYIPWITETIRENERNTTI